MRCSKELSAAVRKTRPSMAELVVGSTHRPTPGTLSQHCLAHGWPFPASLRLNVSEDIPTPPPMAAQWLTRNLRGLRVRAGTHSARHGPPPRLLEWLEVVFQAGRTSLTSMYLNPAREWSDPSSSSEPRAWIDRFWQLRGLKSLACNPRWLVRCLQAYGNDLSPLTSLTSLSFVGGFFAVADPPTSGAQCALSRLTNLKRLTLGEPCAFFVANPTGRELNVAAMTRLTALTVNCDRFCREPLVTLFESLAALRVLRLRGVPSVVDSRPWELWVAPRLTVLDLSELTCEYVNRMLESLTAPSLRGLGLGDPYLRGLTLQALRALLSGAHRLTHFPSLARVTIQPRIGKVDMTPLRDIAGLVVEARRAARRARSQ